MVLFWFVILDRLKRGEHRKKTDRKSSEARNASCQPRKLIVYLSETMASA